MGLFTGLVKAAVNVVTLPIAVVADVATLGGSLSDKDEPYIVDNLKRIVEGVEETVDGDLV